MLEKDVMFLCKCAAAIVLVQVFGMIVLFGVMARMNSRHTRRMRELREMKCKFCRMERLEEGL